MSNIELNPNEVAEAFNVLRDLKESNEGTAFYPFCLRMIYELQREMLYFQSLKESELKAIEDKRVDIGFKKIPSPQYFPKEYEKILGLLCDGLLVKESKFKLAK